MYRGSSKKIYISIKQLEEFRMKQLHNYLDKKSIDDYILVFLVFLGVLSSSITSISLVFYEYDLDYSEGFMIANTENMIDSGNLYTDSTLENGFNAVKYTPIYYFLMAFLSYFTGLELLTGRLINIISTLGIVGVIHLIIKEVTGSKNFLIPLIFVIPYLTVFTASTVRTDMFALLFSLTGIYFVLKDRINLSALLLLAAFFTKQSFVAAFLASSIYLLLQTNLKDQLNRLREKRFKQFLSHKNRFFRLGIFYCSGIVLGLSLLHLWSPHALQNIFLANLAGFEVRWELINWLHLTFLPVFILTLYHIYMSRDYLFGPYMAFATFLMIFQMLRGGAWVHSAIEVYAVMIICVGIIYTKAVKVRKALNYLLVLQVSLLILAPMVSGNILDIKEASEFNKETDQKIISYIQDSEGPIYVEHIGYELGLKEEYSPETWGFYEQYAAGNIDETDVIKHFESREYEYIITHNRLHKLPVEDYIDENYEVIDRLERKDMILNTENWRVYRWED